MDRELAPKLAGWGDRRVEGETRNAAYRLDPHAAVARARVAESERHVSIRPVPDTMVRLSAVLPVAQGVACYAALCRTADTTTASGDERGRGQLMADTLVQRLTGHASAEAVPVEIELVMTDATLLAGGTEPALIPGYGPIPAGPARDLALGTRDDDAPRWLRRLYRHPRQRRARRDGHPPPRVHHQPAPLPAPTRPDLPHPLVRRARPARRPHPPPRRGGPTSITNGQGLCEACNHAKQAPGWQHTREPDGTITTRTPTGHHYRSRPPDPPRGSPTPSPVEIRARALVDLLWAA